MNINSGIKQAVILTIGIMAVVLFLPFLFLVLRTGKHLLFLFNRL